MTLRLSPERSAEVQALFSSLTEQVGLAGSAPDTDAMRDGLLTCRDLILDIGTALNEAESEARDEAYAKLFRNVA